MNKKTIFAISVILNIILAFVFVNLMLGANEKLHFEYVEEDTIRPESLRMYLDMENYGTAASLSHPIRGGAQVDAEYEDYFRLGEYTDLLFLKEVFERAGNVDTAEDCDSRLVQIREEMPDYTVLFDKMDRSAAKAIKE